MSELLKVVEGLRLARDLAGKEPDGADLYFLIEQALYEAEDEAKKRNLPIPPEASPEAH